MQSPAQRTHQPQPPNLMKSIPIFCLCAIFTVAATQVFADEALNKVQTLDAADKTVSRTIVHDSMMGPRDTLVFYRFAAQHAVLTLRIDNQSEKFPITATVNRFADNVDAEKLDHWINNQHSDGLFADAPTAISSVQLPEGTCTVSSHVKCGDRQHGDASYVDFTVKFKVDAFEQKGAFVIKPFTGEASVLVRK